MKAWQLKDFGIENLVLEDIPTPKPKKGACFARNRPPVSVQSGHWFRFKTITHFGSIRPFLGHFRNAWPDKTETTFFF
jgi:hypothetical protein